MNDKNLKVVISQREIKSQVSLFVEAPQSVSNKAYFTSLNELTQVLELPGFRKGKVPKEVVEKHYGVGYVSQKAFEKAFYELLNQASIQEKLDVIDVLEITSYELNPQKPLTFNVVVQLKPEIKLGKYKNLKVNAKKILYNKGEFIEMTLKKLVDNFVTFKKTNDGVVSEGDLVSIDFIGTFEDGSEVPGGKAENYQALLDKDKFLPDFVEKLKGTKIKETKEIILKFPENSKEGFAGKTATFKVTINEIEKKIVPEVNEEFATKLGMENLQKLNERITEQMLEIQNNSSQREFENKIVDRIISDSKFEITDNLIEKEIDFILQDIRHECEKSKISWNVFKKDEKNKELMEKAKESAKRRIGIDLVLNSIAQKENISVTKEELESDVSAKVAKMGEKYKYLEKDNYFIKSVEAVLLRNKTLDFLIKHNEPVWEEEVTKLSSV